MPINCEFCNGTFSDKNSLYSHQKRSKYCLEQRGLEPVLFHCIKCSKPFTEKRYLDSHIIDCVSEKDIKEDPVMEPTDEDSHNKKIQYYREETIRLSTRLEEKEKLIEHLTSQNRDLTSKLENIAIKSSLKPTIYNNTNIMKLERLTESHLRECATMLQPENVMTIEDLAKFASNHSFKNRVYPSDRSRKTLVYRNEDNVLIRDSKGRKLARKFFKTLDNQDDLLEVAYKQLLEELDKLRGDITEEEHDIINNKLLEFINIRRGIKKASKGEEHEIKESFINKICEILPNP